VISRQLERWVQAPRYRLLASDYDGTLAEHGRVAAPTLGALERLRGSGRRLVLITGRQLDDIQLVCPQLELFDRVVAENGAVLFRPGDQSEQLLGQAPPDMLINELGRRGVTPLSVGRVVVATRQPYEDIVLRTIREFGLDLELSLNKGAIMVLPSGVNKASGLRAALKELRISAGETVDIGDAENDQDFLALCGCSAAVADALPALKKRVDYVTAGQSGTGVMELIERLLASNLADPGQP
jgi:hydroxymethylpyrimidine pyrophosphatase-like HAD family hydrolase